MPIFSIPKADKEFWGAEYLTPKGHLSLDCAILRIEIYTRVNSLNREDGQSFRLDDVLKHILGTDKPYATYGEIEELLAPHAIRV